MRIKLTGYFKFSPVKESRVKVSSSSFGEAVLRRAAGFPECLRAARDRDVFNALHGACAELGWYKNGGWMPNGRATVGCSVKNKGDILGVCASAGEYSPTRIWLYCDKLFEEEMTKDFAEPEDVIRNPFSVRNRLLEMKRIPDQKWLDAFCERTHDPDAFARRQQYSRKDAAKLAERCPEMAKYVKLMWRI
jgi:hypothetical protein